MGLFGKLRKSEEEKKLKFQMKLEKIRIEKKLNKQYEIKLKIEPYYSQDSHETIARIDYDSMAILDISDGEYLEIVAMKNIVAKCHPLKTSEDGKQIIRIEHLLRKNASVKFGDSVLVKKASVTPVNSVVVSHVEQKYSKNYIDSRYLTERLEKCVFSVGDMVTVPYFSNHVEFEIKNTIPNEKFLLSNKNTKFEIIRYPPIDTDSEKQLENKEENGPNRYDNDGYDKNGYDYSGFNREGFNREGFNREGFNREGFNREGWDKKGFNREGWDKKGFNREGYDVNGYGKDGYSKHGFDKNEIHRDTGTKFNLEGYDVNGYDKEGLHHSGLLAKLDNFELEITPFKGEQKFAIIRSGGNFDFYDSDSPAYILQVRLNVADEKMKTRLTQSIRNAHHFKPTVFQSKSSVGAYWQTDLIEEEIAKSILLKIIRNYNQFYT